MSNTASSSPPLEIQASRQFPDWLQEHKLSLAFSTYQVGKLFLIGLQPNGKLSVFERTFERCMGLYAQGSSLYMSSLYQLWRFENALQAGQVSNDYDAIYVPQVGYVTGDIDIHDIAQIQEGQPNESNSFSMPEGIIFVNTLFNCLATTSESHQ